MKLRFFSFWLITCLSAVAAGPQLIECAPRGGLPNFFAKLEHGDSLRIAYLGGSITAQEGWRPKTLNWFRQEYPQAKISEINAAIGGTGSDLGAFRLRHDVLGQKPDLLFVEFAVNDNSMPPERIYDSMEGIVRQTWRDNPSTDICFVYTIAGVMLADLKEEKLPRVYEAMENVADHYAIPSIKMGLEVARMERAGKLVFTGAKPKSDSEKAGLGDKILFSPDSIHPYTDSGHQLYFDAVVRGMTLIKPLGNPVPHKLVGPLAPDNWEDAKLVPLNSAKLSDGWRRLDLGTNSLAKKFANHLPELWEGNHPGDSVEFKFKGTEVGIYDILGPDCGQVVITLDNQKPVIHPRFDAYSTYYRLSYLNIGSNLSNIVHTVRVEIDSKQPDKAGILSQRKEKMDDPGRFHGQSWYAGALMLVGNLVE